MASDERRREPRSEVLATAAVFTATHYVGTYIVSNLSAGGALLQGSTSVKVGDWVRILLGLPSGLCVRVEALVLRHERRPTGDLFAVAFRKLPVAIEDVVLAAVAQGRRSRAPAVVFLLSRDAPLGQRVERDLEALDLLAIVGSTPLDAVRLLTGSRPVLAAIVDTTIGLDVCREFVSFLAEDYPYIRRVLLAESAVGRAHAQAVLLRSWSLEELAAALGLPR